MISKPQLGHAGGAAPGAGQRGPRLLRQPRQHGQEGGQDIQEGPGVTGLRS